MYEKKVELDTRLGKGINILKIKILKIKTEFPKGTPEQRASREVGFFHLTFMDVWLWNAL